ncbi:hypothetical protein TWF694_007612 [Orbilia ellipsospora]|uniref:Uncharacterized protein n=1 Tax=Orbilia ellipsospora TaxID=2528407 RepID=A0AAV9XPY0_9PEZI
MSSNEAEIFWGTYESERGTALFHRLVLSICDFLRATMGQIGPSVEASQARLYIGPEMMMLMLQMFEENSNIPAEVRESFDLQRVATLLKAYYGVWHIKYEELPRLGVGYKLPFVRREEFRMWLQFWFQADPDGTHRKLNKILSDETILFLDPFTDEKWEYPVVPRSFYPIESSCDPELVRDIKAQLVEEYTKLSQIWEKERTEKEKEASTKTEPKETAADRLTRLTNFTELGKNTQLPSNSLYGQYMASKKAMELTLQQTIQLQERQMAAMAQNMVNASMMGLASAGAQSAAISSNAIAQGFRTQDSALGIQYKRVYGPGWN